MAKNLPDELADMGKEILHDVSIAIEKQDYSKLASDISNVIKNATVLSIDKKTTYASGKRTTDHNRTYVTSTQYKQKPGYAPFANAKVFKPYPFFMKKIPRHNGAGKIMFGSIGTMCMFPIFLVTVYESFSLAIIAAVGALFLFFIFQIIKGVKKLNLTKLYYEYGKYVGDVEYFDVETLAIRCLKTDAQVKKDLNKMLKEGFLPRARFDSTEKTLMITDNAYHLYLNAEKDRLEREKKSLEKEAEKKVSLDEMSSEMKDIIVDGEDYIKFVRKTNDIIPDTEEMSDKLYRLEEIMNKIFAQVKKDNSSAGELHKLMNYYLPTTKKLLAAYVELDKQPDAGENIVQTKKEISQAMDTINIAFEKLLDSMFQDMAWDISSDISVMKTMMAQDGLTENGGVAMQIKE